MSKTLLITGFDPFGGETVNPAWEAVKRLPEQIGNYMLHKLQIPTVFGAGAQAVLDAAHTLHPNLILCIGQAGGRSAVTPERIAVNIRDAKLPTTLAINPLENGSFPRGLLPILPPWMLWQWCWLQRPRDFLLWYPTVPGHLFATMCSIPCCIHLMAAIQRSASSMCRGFLRRGHRRCHWSRPSPPWRP